MNFNIAYSTKNIPSDWPCVNAKQPIPAQLVSSLRNASSKPSVVGLGVIDTVLKVLRGEVSLVISPDGLQVEYQGSKGTRTLTAENHPQSNMRSWGGELDAMSPPFVLALAEAVTTDLWPEVKERWESLIKGFCAVSNTQAPFNSTTLLTLSRNTHCQDLMLALNDSLYYSLKERQSFIVEHSTPTPLSSLKISNDQWWNQPVTVSKPAVGHSLGRRLERLALTGGAALLAGPTGTFKTETAKRTALALGAALHIVKGRVGLEDRDLLGGIVPGVDGPIWVDGPVTRAFKSAAQQPTVLIVDEFTRFEAFHQALFIGALDLVSVSELQAMGIAPIKDEPHRMIELSTGERVVAPISQLTLIATCNLGDDYQQASSVIDGALLGRFNLICNVERADPAIALGIYQQVTSHAATAAAAQRLEIWSQAHTFETDGNLRRELNPRTVIHLLQEVERCVSTGMARWEAFLEAARCTVIPFCVDRTASGKLDAVGVKLIEDEITLIGVTL